MSGIAGIATFESDTRRHEKWLRAMGKALNVWGTDSVRTERLTSAVMLYNALYVTPLSDVRPQPAVTRGGLLVSWDGRLDNRSDLAYRLRFRSYDETPDIDLVAAAYRMADEGFIDNIVGDFAVALWDTRLRKLCLGRDPFASRPLFFAQYGSHILWASSPHALQATGEFPLRLDNEWVAAYLTNCHSAGWSPFCGIVRSRLRAKGPVCCELSGGMDSSSIVCVADDLIRSGRAQARNIFTYSYVYNRASESDERDFIRLVEAQVQRKSYHILEDDYPMMAGFANVRPQIPFRFQNWPAAAMRVKEILNERGARLVLSGFGGDQLLWSQLSAPYHLADHLVQLRPLSLLREMRLWHQRGCLPYPFLFWDGLVRPIWRMALRRGARDMDFDDSWLTTRVRSSMRGFAARSLAGERGFSLPGQQARYDSIRAAVNGWAWLIDDLAQGYEVSCPFFHRPLVEFCLSIPFDQHVRPGEMRSLHRRALRRILPAGIVNRQCKRGPSDAMMHAIRREWPTILSLLSGTEARIYTGGYVERVPFLKRLEDIRFGLKDDHVFLIRALELEVWLRSIEQ
jgi:asparagine synthase (glutamine-hydrolysing)